MRYFEFTAKEPSMSDITDATKSALYESSESKLINRHKFPAPYRR